jgi:hypothetical protein
MAALDAGTAPRVKLPYSSSSYAPASARR